MLNLMKFWLSYLRLKTIYTIKKIGCSSIFYWLLGNWALSSTLNISVNHLHVSTQFLRSEFLSSSGPGPGPVMVQSSLSSSLTLKQLSLIRNLNSNSRILLLFDWVMKTLKIAIGQEAWYTPLCRSELSYKCIVL